MSIVRRNYGRGHGYTVDGVKLPGVTTILKMRPNDALVGWAARVTGEYAVDNWDELALLKPSARMARLNKARYEDRDAAANRGTAVHVLAERIVVGEEVQVPDELAGHVQSYIDFLDRTHLVPVAVELVLANRTVGYCGTGDLVADLPAFTWRYEKIPAARWLLDLKTSRSGIFPEAALQMTAYARGEVYADGTEEKPVRDLGIERNGAVHIRADGWDLRPTENSDATWKSFRHLKWLFDHAEDEASWIGEAVDPPPLVAPAVPAPRDPSELDPGRGVEHGTAQTRRGKVRLLPPVIAMAPRHWQVKPDCTALHISESGNRA